MNRQHRVTAGDGRVMKRRAVVCLALGVLFGIPPIPVARAQLRIVDYNVAQLQGVQADLQGVFAALNTDDKDGFAVPPAIYLFEEVLNANTTPILNMLNAAAPPGVTYARGTYTNFNEDVASGAQALYYRTNPPIVTEDASGHADIFISGASRYTDRYKMKLAGYASPNATFYIYVTHLKAGNTSPDATARTSAATAIRNNADFFSAGTRIVYAGDFNVYNNTEGAYLEFLSAGNGQAVDPLGTGSWAGAGFAIKHTQSPCTTCVTGLVGGGLDDRFDFQLTTQALQNGTGLSIMGVASAYRPFGNDGLHYNQAVNAGDNHYYPADIPRSNTLANKLVDASDHLPVVVDFQLPAIMSASLPANFGRVIQGASYGATLSVSNTANVVISSGADTLAFSAVASGGLSGLSGGSVQALQPAATHDFAVDTSTVGAVNGSVLVTSSSDSVQNPSIPLSTTGSIVRHSSGSFSNSSSISSATTNSLYIANTGAHNIYVDINNYGYDGQQALLDLDGVSGMSAPFAFVGGLAFGVGASAQTLTFSFDTTGALGAYQNVATINISDEDLPGATGGTLTLTLNAQVFNLLAADINCDGIVDFADVAAMADVLLGVDSIPCHVSRADMNASGIADGADIAIFNFVFLNQ